MIVAMMILRRRKMIMISFASSHMIQCCLVIIGEKYQQGPPYLGIKMNLYTVASPPPHSYIGPSWQIVDFNNLFTRSSEQSRCFPFTQHFSVFLLSQLQHRLISAKRLHIVRPIGISGPSSLNTRLWKVQCQLLANSRLKSS